MVQIPRKKKINKINTKGIYLFLQELPLKPEGGSGPGTILKAK